MTQKLLILERDSKKELREAIIKNILDPKNNMRLISFSVLEHMPTTYVDGNIGHINRGYFEAWCVVEVPENMDRFYEEVEKMGMSE